MNYRRITEAVFHDDATLPCVLLHEMGKTRVYRINTPDPIIIRVAKGDTSSHEYQATLQAELAAQDNLTARILYWETREIKNQVYGIQVQTFVPGKPIECYPNREQEKAIVDAVYKLQQRLHVASGKVGNNSTQSIHSVMSQMYPLVNECPIKTAASKLLKHKRYLELISQPEQCLIYGDLWYKNVHLEQSKNESVVRFVDIDPLILGPSILQPAILFSSYFLVSSLLLEPDNLNTFNLDDLLSYWPEPLDKYDVLLMMFVFPIGLGLLKEYQFSQNPNMDPMTRRMILEPFEQSVQIINELLIANQSKGNKS